MLPKLIENRKILLQDNRVLETLGEIDLLITEKSVNTPIMHTDNTVAFNQLTMMSKNILLDIGIKQAEPYEIGRFCDVVMRYYKSLSVNEIKLAFELLLIGELDPYLPKDKNGEPDKNHYQSFSFEYISKVLKAYKKRKDRTWQKAHLALPDPTKKEPTEEDRKKSRERFIESIKEAFNAYAEHHLKVRIYVPAYWVSFLHERGFIKKAPELSDKTIKEAYRKIITKEVYVDERTKQDIEKDFNQGKNHPILLRNSEHEYYYELIYQFFDYLLKNNKDLNDLI